MTDAAQDLKQNLRNLGISQAAIKAVWPTWWSDDAAVSRSAEVELRFTVARRLGLSPKSLIGKDEPSFIWRHEAKFKGLTKYDGREESALSSFGISLARTLTNATTRTTELELPGLTAAKLRTLILKQSPNVSLQDLCATCWGLGIPVIHLRVFPLTAKHMVAMAVKSGDRYAILIGKDASYPAPTAYHLAHEMGHIARRHLDHSKAIIDLDEPIEMEDRDTDESEADAFAMELLTGDPTPTIEMNERARNGAELASAVLNAATQRSIEPGTLALCYGHKTDEWAVTYAALAQIYANKHDVWKFLNQFATRELLFDTLEDDSAAYLKAILGAAELA